MVYISTDYIFDGINPDEYQFDDPTNPKNEYGKIRLAGELWMIRTSCILGKYGKNLVYMMLRLAEYHDKLTVIDDQFSRSSTWTRTLVEFMTYLVDNDQPFGTYQLSNEGSCFWYEFASEILKDKDVEVAPVTSEAYPQKAYRPRHSIMSLDKAEDTGFKVLSWQDALEQFLKGI